MLEKSVLTYLANILTSKSWSFLFFLILTPHHPTILAIPSVTMTTKASSDKLNIWFIAFDPLLRYKKFSMRGSKSNKALMWKGLAVHTENQISGPWTLFSLCGWRSCRLMLRLHHKCTPHACMSASSGLRLPQCPGWRWTASWECDLGALK